MTDEQVGVIVMLVFALLVLFIGVWFGWSKVLWIVISAVVLIVVIKVVAQISQRRREL